MNGDQLRAPAKARAADFAGSADNAGMRAPTVYLAGFDVFRPDAVAQGEGLKACCAAQGWQGLHSLKHSLHQSRCQGRSGFVQHQDLRLTHQSACKGQLLALSARQRPRHLVYALAHARKNIKHSVDPGRKIRCKIRNRNFSY